jgi:hypothetical protein
MNTSPNRLTRLVLCLGLGLGLAATLLCTLAGVRLPIAQASPPVGTFELPAAACQARLSNGAEDGPIYPSVQTAVNAATPLSNVIKVAGDCIGVEQWAGDYQVAYISKSLTIRGGYTTTNWAVSDPAVNTTTLDAQWSGRVLYITGTGTTVTVENLRVINGDAEGSDGGGVYNDASSALTLDGVTISDCGSGGLDRGGGIYNEGVLTLTNVTLTDNEAYLDGGGMYNIGGSVTLTSVVFSGNSAGSFGSLGGGMYNDSGSPTLTDVTFSGNSTGEYGGGGGMYNSSGSPTLTNVTFSNNTAEFGYGGGMYNSTGSPTLISVTFNYNSATAEEGGGCRGGWRTWRRDVQWLWQPDAD